MDVAVVDDAVSTIAEEAPYIAAILILSAGHLWVLYKTIHAHVRARESQEDRWIERVQVIAGDCHGAQDRASRAIEKLSESEKEIATSLSGLNVKVDTVISLARKA